MIDQIRDEWNRPVSEAHKKAEMHAPVVVNEEVKLIHRDTAALMFNLINEENLEFRNAYIDNDLVGVCDALADVLYLVYGTASQYGIDDTLMGKLLKEVHRSNLTKLVDGKVIVREDGKILKPDTYEAPRIKELLEENGVKIPNKLSVNSDY